ncbi:MAG: class II glutamine amidotransferase [Lautropia sp.]
MCRWVAFTGRETRLEDVVTRPARSLVHQSLHAAQCRTTTNGDGFGLGWYGDRETPALYRDATPAWADENLQSLCAQLRAQTFFAHVRASTNATTSRANCHPFSVGRTLFMHNGQIGGYERIRRTVENMIPDRFYPMRRGSTDTEAIFLAAMGRIERDGPIVAFSDTLGRIHDAMRDARIDEPLRFAAAFTDGELLTVIRWASDPDAPTVCWRSNEEGLTVASEPLDEHSADWHELPRNHVLTACCGKSPVRPAVMPFVVGHEAVVEAAQRPLPVALLAA